MKKIKAKELNITPECIKNRGAEKAIDYALALIRKEFLLCRLVDSTDAFSIELYRVPKEKGGS